MFSLGRSVDMTNYFKNELANVDLDITMVLNTKNKYDLYLNEYHKLSS